MTRIIKKWIWYMYISLIPSQMNMVIFCKALFHSIIFSPVYHYPVQFYFPIFTSSKLFIYAITVLLLQTQSPLSHTHTHTRRRQTNKQNESLDTVHYMSAEINRHVSVMHLNSSSTFKLPGSSRWVAYF